MYNDPRKLLLKNVHDLKTILNDVEQHTESLLNFKLMCKSVAVAIASGNKILIAGNGGSANDASHLATELGVRFEKTRKPYAAISLAADVGILTATANDFDYTQVFARQVEALGNKGDIFIGISTSGNSENIVNALNVAKNKELTTFLLTGNNRNTKCEQSAETTVNVSSDNTARIQELHRIYYHSLCEFLEKTL